MAEAEDTGSTMVAVRRLLRRTSLRRAATTILIGALAATAAAMVAPSVTVDAGPGAVEVDVRPGTGGTSIEIPPLGTVSAGTHLGPARVNVRLMSVDIDAAADAGNHAKREAIVDALPDTLRRAVMTYLAMVVFIAGGLGVLFAAAAKRRSIRRCVGAALAAMACVGTTTAWTTALFDPGAFTRPRFTGALVEAPEAWRRVNSAIGNISTLRGRLDGVAAQIDALWSDAGELSDEAHTTILHVSDIHLNPVGASLTTELAQRFGVDAVIDTGDVTSFGMAFESDVYDSFLTANRVDHYVVFGNHDSNENRKALSSAMTPLDGRVVDIGGVRVLGLDDPTFTPRGPVDPADLAAATERARARLAEMCAKEQPDVLAVHNPNLASAATGCAPVVIAGHLHRPAHFTTADGVRVSVSGSTGAGGVAQLDRSARYEAELLHFSTDGTLTSVDVISLDPTNGQFAIERIPAELFTDDADYDTVPANQ